jgi:hypothetical protein
LEREAVKTILTCAGTEVIDIEQATHTAFCEAYEDPEIDLLWLCSHGVQDHHRPHLSGLYLDDDDFMTLDQLYDLKRPDTDSRRLLVLNVCDAGAAPRIEGSMALGVAAVLASQTQTVISHLWPVQSIPAATFGTLLASHLRADPDHLTAFARALAALSSGRDAILKSLRSEPGCAEIAQRVNNNDLPWDSVFNWGSPIMVT